VSGTTARTGDASVDGVSAVTDLAA
jgi:hypothetical protein